MKVPKSPKIIDITFKERASREEVLGILEHVEPLEIRQTIINGVHRVLMETKPKQPLSDAAKEHLQEIKSNGHAVRFPSVPKRSR